MQASINSTADSPFAGVQAAGRSAFVEKALLELFAEQLFAELRNAFSSRKNEIAKDIYGPDTVTLFRANKDAMLAVKDVVEQYRKYKTSILQHKSTPIEELLLPCLEKVENETAAHEQRLKNIQEKNPNEYAGRLEHGSPNNVGINQIALYAINEIVNDAIEALDRPLSKPILETQVAPAA